MISGSVRSMGLNKNKKKKMEKAPPNLSSKQQITKRRRGSLSRCVKEMVNYLKSDSYLYSELISSSNSVDFVPLTTQDTNGIEGRSKTKASDESIEYLKSDTYMHSPLINLATNQTLPPPAEVRGNQVRKVMKVRWNDRYATTKEVARKTRRRKII